MHPHPGLCSTPLVPLPCRPARRTMRRIGTDDSISERDPVAPTGFHPLFCLADALPETFEEATRRAGLSRGNSRHQAPCPPAPGPDTRGGFPIALRGLQDVRDSHRAHAILPGQDRLLLTRQLRRRVETTAKGCPREDAL